MMKPDAIPSTYAGQAVRFDNVATYKLARALARKLETEAMLKRCGRTSPKPLGEVVKEATQCPK
jgi:hypothetical protein